MQCTMTRTTARLRPRLPQQLLPLPISRSSRGAVSHRPVVAAVVVGDSSHPTPPLPPNPGAMAFLGRLRQNKERPRRRQHPEVPGEPQAAPCAPLPTPRLRPRARLLMRAHSLQRLLRRRRHWQRQKGAKGAPAGSLACLLHGSVPVAARALAVGA